jgi:hypothetical protein
MVKKMKEESKQALSCFVSKNKLILTVLFFQAAYCSEGALDA